MPHPGPAVAGGARGAAGGTAAGAIIASAATGQASSGRRHGFKPAPQMSLAGEPKRFGPAPGNAYMTAGMMGASS